MKYPSSDRTKAKQGAVVKLPYQPLRRFSASMAQASTRRSALPRHTGLNAQLEDRSYYYFECAELTRWQPATIRYLATKELYWAHLH